jgi:glutamate/tyrosine decarboxylase-like PLP-dependent enzyme
MTQAPESDDERRIPLDLSPEEFRELGHRLVDRLADFLAALPDMLAGPNATRAEVLAAVGPGPLPEEGSAPGPLLDQAADLLMRYSRINGHPRSWGYVIGTPAPIGILGDFLASGVNPNCAAWTSAPVAAEIERQVVTWIAELLGYPTDCGGLLVSGGNMANLVGFWAARRAKADWDLRTGGVNGPDARRLCLYASEETHTWIQKAADLSGLGTDAIRWIPTDGALRLDMDALRTRIEADRAAGDRPFLVVGSAGTVSTGAVDPLPEIAALCREHDLWFHVDGAYGAFAVVAPDTPPDLAGLREADSIAVDGHKWLFAPLEAGCALVRDRAVLHDTFRYQPSYYHHATAPEDDAIHYHEYGPQNSRAFRALKLWLALRQVGRRAYEGEVDRNIRLSLEMFRAIDAAPELEAVTQSLSIATFRYLPASLDPEDAATADYLNALNASLVVRVQKSGEIFISNAVIGGRFLLRACITNFRTQSADVRAVPEIVRRHGAALDREMRPEGLGR